MTNRVQGLGVGIVTDTKDPEKRGRVCVKFPWLSDDQTTWVRLTQPMAGKGRGFQFIPEIDDEVIVGFEHGDMQYPIVLGCLWNGVDTPPDNDYLEGSQIKHRVIKTRIGHTLLFDDENGQGEVKITTKSMHTLTLNDKDKKIEAETAGKLKVLLDDQNRKIVVSDASNNSVTIDSTQSSITITCTGNMSLKCQGSMSLESTGPLSVKGTAGVQIESPAVTSVKGSLVNINSG